MSEPKTPEPTWKTIVHGLIVHPSNPSFLVRRTSDGKSRLPFVEHAGRLWTGGLVSKSEAFGSEAGGPVRFLRWTYFDKDTESRVTDIGALFELVTGQEDGRADAEPDDATGVGEDAVDGAGSTKLEWLGRDVLPSLPGLQRRIAAAWLSEVESRADIGLRPPWAQERGGWYEDVERWIDKSLAEVGRQRLGPIEQAKVWSISCVLRVPATEGTVYYKASIQQPLFVNEARVTRALETLALEFAPKVVATNDEEGWLVLEDLGPSVTDRLRMDSPEYHDVSMNFVVCAARWQRATAMCVDELLEAGCIDRRMSKLAGQIAPLTQDPHFMRAEQESETAAGWLSLNTRRLEAACTELDALPIPAALVHGDLHLGNVAERDGSFAVFDWTDACIAHPFMDMTSIFFIKDDDNREALRTAYLSAWSDLATGEELERTWALASVAFELHQLITYVSIMNHVEPAARPDLWGALPMFIDRLVAGVERMDG